MTKPHGEPPVVRWLGAAAFELRTSQGMICFDPWLTDNPGCPIASVDELSDVAIVVVGHGHPGHFGKGDSARLALVAGARFIAPAPLAQYVLEKYRLRRDRVIAVDPGATVRLGALTLEPFEVPHPPVRHEFTTDGPPGAPNLGYLVRIDGKVILHVGDTTPDPIYAKIAARTVVDLAMLPLWAKEMVWDEQQAIDSMLTVLADLRPRTVIPHARYRQSVCAPARAAAALAAAGSCTTLLAMRPGDEVTVGWGASRSDRRGRLT